MLDTIFFDLDGTLLDFQAAENRAILGTLARLGVPPLPETAARYSAINQAQWELLEEGKLTRPQVLLRRFDLLFGELGLDRSSREAQSIYEELLSRGHDYLPGAQALLERLYGTYRLYLVSNGTAYVQARRLRDSGIRRYFTDIFISEEVGYDKPARAFFDRCFAAIPDFHRERALIVGDSITSDMRGGINAGIRTCWFNPRRRPRPADVPVDLELERLEDLPPLLETL